MAVRENKGKLHREKGYGRKVNKRKEMEELIPRKRNLMIKTREGGRSNGIRDSEIERAREFADERD